MPANEDKDAWKSEYIALLDKPTVEEVQLPQAKALKIQKIPRFLYRYKKFDEHAESELKDGYFWLSHPDDFNDPFDSALLISEDILLKKMFRGRPDLLLGRPWMASLTEDERQRVRASEQPFKTSWEILQANGMLADPRSSEEAFQTFIEDCRASDKKVQYVPFASLKNTLRISCFCENFSSVLMWSHYAKNHAGICVEYPTKELLQDPEIAVFLHPVIYKAERFDSTNHFDPAGIRKPNILSPTLASCHKSPDWSYEKEWRLVIPVRPGDSNQKFPINSKPSRILAGTKVKPDDLEKIKALAATISAPVSVGEMSETDFSIVFK
jgi:hypothetical protein